MRSNDGSVRSWGLRSRRPRLLRAAQSAGKYFALALDPTGRFLVDTNKANTARLWDLDTQVEQSPLMGLVLR